MEITAKRCRARNEEEIQGKRENLPKRPPTRLQNLKEKQPRKKTRRSGFSIKPASENALRVAG
jgi:hypothetical protein